MVDRITPFTTEVPLTKEETDKIWFKTPCNHGAHWLFDVNGNRSVITRCNCKEGQEAAEKLLLEQREIEKKKTAVCQKCGARFEPFMVERWNGSEGRHEMVHCGYCPPCSRQIVYAL
jgi:hypothetical protein